jgi:hypothetical protein
MTHRELRCRAKISFVVVLGYLEVFAREWPEWASERPTKYGEPIGDDARGSPMIKLSGDWQCFLVDGWVALTAELMRMVVRQEWAEWHCQNHRVHGSALNKSQAEWREKSCLTKIGSHRRIAHHLRHERGYKFFMDHHRLPSIPCEVQNNWSLINLRNRSDKQNLISHLTKKIDRDVYWFVCVAFGFSHLASLGLRSNAMPGTVLCLVRRSKC